MRLAERLLLCCDPNTCLHRNREPSKSGFSVSGTHSLYDDMRCIFSVCLSFSCSEMNTLTLQCGLCGLIFSAVWVPFFPCSRMWDLCSSVNFFCCHYCHSLNSGNFFFSVTFRFLPVFLLCLLPLKPQKHWQDILTRVAHCYVHVAFGLLFLERQIYYCLIKKSCRLYHWWWHRNGKIFTF